MDKVGKKYRKDSSQYASHEIEFGHKAVYRPRNFGHSYSNQQVTLREAIVRSLNVVAVDAAMQAGLENVAEMAARLGLPRPQIYPSMALGAFETTPLDIARAYTTFANDGVRVDPLAIRTIKANGDVLITGAASKASVLPSSLAYLVTDTLADVVNRGTAARIRSLGYRGPAAGKTGTSPDAWFVGYTANLLVVVWVGNDDNSDLRLTGAEAAVPIWADFITRALQLRPDLAGNQVVKPAGLETVEIGLPAVARRDNSDQATRLTSLSLRITSAASNPILPCSTASSSLPFYIRRPSLRPLT